VKVLITFYIGKLLKQKACKIKCDYDGNFVYKKSGKGVFLLLLLKTFSLNRTTVGYLKIVDKTTFILPLSLIYYNERRECKKAQFPDPVFCCSRNIHANARRR
jgi:hypothetical protein